IMYLEGFIILFSTNFVVPTYLASSQSFIQDFAIIMIVAAIVLLVTYRLKQPMVIGYILVGIIIGPHTPPFSYITDIETINAIAELGIIMLLFVIGTEFPISKLKSVGKISAIVALSETLGTLVISFFVAQTLNFSYYDSLFIALAMSITSTVITIRVLQELNMVNDKSTTLLLGISIVEDILAITILGILQSVAIQDIGIGIGSGEGGGEVNILTIVVSLVIVGLFIGGILIFGSRYLTPLINKIGKTNNYTLFLLSILGLGFGLAVSAQLLGLSTATGAFLAEVLVAESKHSSLARVITIPLRDLFAAVFFISVGMLMEISAIGTIIVPALILIMTSFVSKLFIVTGILIKTKYSNITALRTGLGMAMAKGELSLVVVKTGYDSGITASFLLPLVGVVAMITTFVTPYVIKFGKQLGKT
ncbi:MAG TPA: cation:proton antiporter, partial [Nitrososphaeraceae archaeon]|nr:cation:proton antiporter [Nitrososphaeraceae archaeon]